MVEVAKKGSALIADVNSAAPPAGSIAFWWMGQESFIFKGAGKVVYIDPYLDPSPARQTPPALRPDEVTNADLILCTHDHGDHVDRSALPGILRASPRAILMVSRVVAHRLIGEGYPADRVVGIDDGETREIAGVTVSAIRAAHEFFDRDEKLGYPHLGYVVRLNGASLFHAGDGVPWEGLVAALRARRPDAIFVPINGRDAERYRRHCIGNFTFQEAVDLVGALHPALAVPMHYDMFIGNQERVDRFVDYLDAKYPGIPHWVGSAGERAVLTARSGAGK